MKAALVVLLLVAPAASLHVQQGTCSCIAWKSAYNDHKVMCGQGYELRVDGPEYVRLPRAQLPSRRGNNNEFCNQTYMKISFAGCLNKGFGTSTEQWCYVSQDCTAEDTEAVEGTDLAIKECAEGDGMEDIAPETLNKLADVDHLEMGLLGRLTYAVAPEKWSDVEGASGLSHDLLNQTHTLESFMGLKWTDSKPMTKAATDKLGEIRASGIATIFDTDNENLGRGGGTLILGTRTYMFGPRTDNPKAMGYVELV